MQTTLLRVEIAAELVSFFTNIANGVIDSIQTFTISTGEALVIISISNTDNISGRFTLNIEECDSDDLFISPAAQLDEYLGPK